MGSERAATIQGTCERQLKRGNPTARAQFGYVTMPDYRWGIFLQPRDEKREDKFRDSQRTAAGQEVQANIARLCGV